MDSHPHQLQKNYHDQSKLREQSPGAHFLSRSFGRTTPSKSPFSKLGVASIDSPPYSRIQHQRISRSSQGPQYYSKLQSADKVSNERAPETENSTPPARKLFHFSAHGQESINIEGASNLINREILLIAPEKISAELAGSAHYPKSSLDAKLKEEYDPASDSAAIFSGHNTSAGSIKYTQVPVPGEISEVASSQPLGDMMTNRISMSTKANSTRGQSFGTVSRSTSSVPRNESAEDDLSALMFKGATDLRNAKFALEEQLEKNSSLRDEFSKVTEEKKDLEQQLRAVKRKATECTKSTATRLSELETLLKSLKQQSGVYSTVVTKSRKEIEGYEDVKTRIKAAEEQIEGFRGDDGTFTPTQAWRRLLGELQLDVRNRLQVIDLYRDRLETAQADLAEARNRVTELEFAYSTNTEAIKISSEKLLQAESSLSELAKHIKQQQSDNIELLTSNADLEAAIKIKDHAHNELRQQLTMKESELQGLSSVKEELCSVQTLAKDREEQLSKYVGIEIKLQASMELLKDRDLKIESLQASLFEKSDSLKVMQEILIQLEAKLADQKILLERLESELTSNRAALEAEFDFRSKIIDEQSKACNREEQLTLEVTTSRRDCEIFKLKHCQSEAREQRVLERLEDWSVMLRMEKSAHTETQERFSSAEASFAKSLEDEKKISELQIHQMSLRIDSLETALQGRKSELTTLSEKSARDTAILLSDHAQGTESLKKALDNKSLELEEARLILSKSQNAHDLLLSQNESLQQELVNLHKELDTARTPSETLGKKMENMADRLEVLRKEKEILDQRAASIVKRYESSDLSAEEKQLIDLVHRASQSNHERHLVSKANELRQRDNLIKSLEKSKAELEAQLARVLNNQAEAKATDGTAISGNRPLIDPIGWISSQSSSTLQDAQARAPDRDEMTISVDTDCNADEIVTVSVCTPPSQVQRNMPFAPVLQRPAEKVAKPQITYKNKSTTFFALAKSTEMSDDKENEKNEGLYEDTTKRKRGPETSHAYVEKARPLRRSKTANSENDASIKAGTSEESGTKILPVAPKVKARKRR